jgi:carboxyl-terminal processing protease
MVEEGGVPSPPTGMPRREKTLLIVAVVVSLLVVASCFLIPYIFNKDDKVNSATRSQSASQEYSEEEAWLENNKSFNDALTVTMEDYVERPDEGYLIAAAARGISRLKDEGAAEDVLTERAITTMLDALDDPFSGYMDKQQVSSLDTQLSGHFFGIGVSMAEVRNEIRVQEVLKGTPAEAAGIQQGDIVVMVDGKEVTGMNINDVVAMIRGQEGTRVKVGFKRSGVPGTIEYDLTRAEIKLPVITTQMLPGDVGYIILTDWTQDSSELLKGALEDLKNQGAKGLILDLRNNPGGLMDPAIKSADLFLGGGTIVTSKGRMAGTTVPYTATPGTSWDYPVVILTNRGTASSSEIFSAALHDNDRAVLVGETTFGKGEIQQLKRQPDGSALRITVALYYTPDGTSINDEGIAPDVIVTNPTMGEEDLQLVEAQRVVTAIMQGQAWK